MRVVVSACVAESRKWFVSQSGIDDTTCGTALHTACRRLDVAVGSARPGDVIRLDPAVTPYLLPCVSHRHLGLTLQSLTVVALNSSGRPTIGCDEAATERCALTLQNVTMIGVDLEADDCHVTIVDSHLRDSTVYSTHNCRWLRMRVARTDWTFSGHLPCSKITSRCNVTEPCQHMLSNHLSCGATDVTLDRVRLVLGSLVIVSRYSAHVYVARSQLIADPDKPENQFLGGLHLTFSAVGANITVVDCVFSNQASV